MKAQQLNSLLDQQEGFGGGGGGNNSTFDNFAGNSNSPFEVFRGNNNNNSTMIGNNAAPNTQDSFAFEFGVNNMNQGGNQRGNNGGGINVPCGRRRF